jgi:hypothetical protein
MSRHEVPAKPANPKVIRGTVGWDRPLQTFFAQVFALSDEEGEGEEAIVWVGSFPGELPTAAAALAVIAPYCEIPDGLAATLETDKLKTLAQVDGPAQRTGKLGLRYPDRA